MLTGTPPASQPGGGRKWLPLVLIGGVAITAGVLLPQMLGNVAPPPASIAAEPENKESLDYVPPSWPEGPDASSMLTRLVVGTVVVIALCAGTLIVCRRWLRRLPGQPTGNTRMTLIETLPLGNRCQVHLIRVGKQQVLVGLDGGGLKSLVALPDAFEDALTDATEQPTAEPPPPIAQEPALAVLVGPQKTAW